MKKILSIGKKILIFLLVISMVSGTGYTGVVNNVNAASLTEVTIGDDWRNAEGNTDKGFYFTVSPSDSLESDITNWSIRYTPSKGGVYVNGVLNSEIKLVKVTESLYYIALSDYGISVQNEMKVKIDCEVTSGDTTVSYLPATFKYIGSGNWTLVEDEVVNETVSLGNDARNADDASDTTGGFYFITSPSDSLPYDTNNWTTKYEAISGGVYVDEELKSDVKLVKILANLYYVALSDSQITPVKGMKVKIDGVFGNENIHVKYNETTFIYEGSGKWQIDDGKDDEKDDEKEPVVNNTVTIGDDWRNNTGDTKTGFYFTVSPADELAYDTENWTKKYEAISGGIYVDETLMKDIRIIKVTESLYYVSLGDYQIEVKDGMKVKIDGIFGNSLKAVKYLPATFKYLGKGKWTLDTGIEEETLYEDSTHIYDLYDLNGVSKITVPKDSYYNLTDLKAKTNVGVKLHIQDMKNKDDVEDVTFGLSKAVANNVWVDSGYQIKISPSMGRILILTEAEKIVATTFSEEVKTDFDMEIAVVNMKDKDGKLKARKVYVKINDNEVASYLDYNLERELGTYMPVYATKNINVVLESCTKKGYVLVNKTPNVLDISKLNSGLKNVETKADACTHIGTATDSTNVAIRTKVKFNKSFSKYEEGRYDEVKFAFSKDSKETIWDENGTGYQVWLRPGQIFIGYDMDSYGTVVSYNLPKEFVLEIGTYDVQVRVQDGKKDKFVRNYGRMVYVKVDGQEVASWLDTNLKRKFGKEALVWHSTSTDITLTSLTSDKYLIRQKNKVYDLFDATGLSEAKLSKNAITKLGSLPKSSDMALKTKVKFNKKSEEFKIALSKTSNETIWDLEESGWQFWFRPASSQIFIGYGMSEYATVTAYEFPKSGEFVLEIGQRNVVYNNGKKYGREVYIKIDGKEITSWIDKDYNRTIGNYALAYASQNSNIVLTSLTTTGYIPVEKEAQVSDIFDLSGYAELELVKGQCINLGKIKNPKNKAVKMNVDLKKSTEMTEEFKLAIGKVSDSTIWDIEKSGWQFWFRPVSNQIFIGYGESEYAEVVGYEFPNRFQLEIGTSEVYLKNGKYYGFKVYVKIDGKEVVSWIDTDSSRKIGENVIAYASGYSNTTLSTLNTITTIPVSYIINDEVVDECKWIDTEAKVVQGKDTKINVTVKKDVNTKVDIYEVCQNETQLKCIGQVDNVYTYLTIKPKNTDKLIFKLTTAKLSTDKAKVYDLFEVMKKQSVTVKALEDVQIGNMYDNNGETGINSAVQFELDLPEGFNQVRFTILGDGDNVWSYHGAMF